MMNNVWLRILIGLMVWLVGIIIITPIARQGKLFSEFKTMMFLGTLTLLVICYFKLTSKER